MAANFEDGPLIINNLTFSDHGEQTQDLQGCFLLMDNNRSSK